MSKISTLSMIDGCEKELWDRAYEVLNLFGIIEIVIHKISIRVHRIAMIFTFNFDIMVNSSAILIPMHINLLFLIWSLAFE